METRHNEVISYLAHEGEMARMERVNNRLFLIVIVLILALIGTNAAWIWYESQWEYFDTTTQEVTQDVQSDGDSIVTGTGDIHYEQSTADR